MRSYVIFPNPLFLMAMHLQQFGFFYCCPSEIYHLACPASPPHYQFNAVKTIKTSFQGTLNMLGLAKRTKARFLLTSTSGELYPAIRFPLLENCPCTHSHAHRVVLTLVQQKYTVTPRYTHSTKTSKSPIWAFC